VVAEPGSPWRSRETYLVFLKFVLVFVFLDTFLVSINLMGVFKSMGHGFFEETIAGLAANPLMGFMVGLLATSVFQSSSTTTSLVVGLVAIDFLQVGIAQTLQAMIPVVMGANIGTTVTNALVSFGHIGRKEEFNRAFGAATVHDLFNVLTTIILLPLQIWTNFLGKFAFWAATSFENVGGTKFASPLKMLIAPQLKWVKSGYDHPWAIRLTVVFFISFLAMVVVRRMNARQGRSAGPLLISAISALVIASLVTLAQRYASVVFSKEVAILALALGGLFTSLFWLVKLMRAIMFSKLEILFHRYVFKSALRSLVMGCILTALVQSSSVTTSLVVPLAGAGILTIYQIFPFTLGANIGTTVTAILAALSTGQLAAIAVAFAHSSFNMLGVLLFYFEPMRSIPVRLAIRLAQVSANHRVIPFLFVGILFFVIPFLCIYFF